MRRRFKLDVLMSALGARRSAEGLSWREVGRQAGVSASTLTRMQQGGQPDVDTVVALLTWLNMPLDSFLTEGPSPRPQAAPVPTIPPALQAALAPLLRNNELPQETAEFLSRLLVNAQGLYASVSRSA